MGKEGGLEGWRGGTVLRGYIVVLFSFFHPLLLRTYFPKTFLYREHPGICFLLFSATSDVFP